MVIEDDPSWVEILKMWFSEFAYPNIQFAASGVRGLEAAIKEPPDCIILDLVLPDMSGMDVCQGLRALPALARVPVILLTGHPREKVLGLQNGADYFVAKAEKPHELLATLEAAFRRKQADEGVLVRGDLTLRPRVRQVEWKGSLAATLSPKAFTLFYALVERGPQPVGRDHLYRLVEGTENPGLSRALDVLLTRLRKVLPPPLAARIANVKNFGYAFLDVE